MANNSMAAWLCADAAAGNSAATAEQMMVTVETKQAGKPLLLRALTSLASCVVQ
jgi:hypothetical protein